MKRLFLAALAVTLVACGAALDLSVTTTQLARCEQVGRDAPDGGHIKAYDDCKKDAGL
jgi:hypothetical protein